MHIISMQILTLEKFQHEEISYFIFINYLKFKKHTQCKKLDFH